MIDFDIPKIVILLKIVLDLHEPVSGAVVTNTLSCREHFSLEQEIIEMLEAKGLFRQKLISCRKKKWRQYLCKYIPPLQV